MTGIFRCRNIPEKTNRIGKDCSNPSAAVMSVGFPHQAVTQACIPGLRSQGGYAAPVLPDCLPQFPFRIQARVQAPLRLPELNPQPAPQLYPALHRTQQGTNRQALQQQPGMPPAFSDSYLPASLAVPFFRSFLLRSFFPLCSKEDTAGGFCNSYVSEIAIWLSYDRFMSNLFLHR